MHVQAFHRLTVISATWSKYLSRCSTVSPASSAAAAMIRSGTSGARCRPASSAKSSTARSSTPESSTPQASTTAAAAETGRSSGPGPGDDETRSWEDSRSYGYASAAAAVGGASHSTAPSPLPGVRLPSPRWIRGHRARSRRTGIDQRLHHHEQRQPRSLLDIPLRTVNLKRDATDPDRPEFIVRVDWEWTVPAGRGCGPSTSPRAG